MSKQIVDENLLALAHERAVEYLRMIPERSVAPRMTREELMQALSVPLRDDGEDPAAVIDSLARAAERGTMGTTNPRFFGFVIGGSLPVTVAADWLTTAWDQNSGIYVAAPLSSVVEDVAHQWLLDLFDLPRESSIGFVTGCQMANYTALAAARHAVLRRVGWNVEEGGLYDAPRVNLIVSAEAHVTIHTAMRYLGFGMRNLREVPTDEQGRMRADALREIVAAVDGPTIICAQAGNVNTGAIDPLREIAGIAKEKNAWVHVDGAFGLWGRASRDRRSLLDGVELCDSWATDAHKWLNVPFDNGIVIVRDSASHRASMTVSAAYLEQTSGVERDPVDWNPEFSRRGRGITVYAALRTLGRRGVKDLVDRLCARARQFESILRADPRVEILNEVVLNQVLVRFKGNDEATRETIARVQRDGTLWLAGTTWHGLAAMRISVSNWATTEEDVERSAAAILRSIP
jgi:glutamate/tyrosine decarboxylase-like PLP-dependent enzyme